MTLNACILIKTKPLQSGDILNASKRLPGVRKVFIAYGRFDLVALAEANDYPDLRKLTGTINSIAGVRSTETLVEA
jgi:DNA-binding Lrp family transcriptional regulator